MAIVYTINRWLLSELLDYFETAKQTIKQDDRIKRNRTKNPQWKQCKKNKLWEFCKLYASSKFYKYITL